MGIKEAQEQEALMQEKARLRDHMKCLGLSTQYKNHFEYYWPIMLDIADRHNGNHAEALKGAMRGFETAMKRFEKQETAFPYTSLEANLCAQVAVSQPDQLGALLMLMEKGAVTNSNALGIARKAGIEQCLPPYLRR